MRRNIYIMTATAERQFWEALSDTHYKWGHAQAEKYRVKFLAGLQHIADNHRTFNSPHRNELAKDTAFSIHLVEHRYVAFQEHDKNTIIITAVFHESMDIPAQLKELRNMAQHEIEALKQVL